MDVLPLSKVSRNESSQLQSHIREPRKENFDDLPKCFRAISGFRQDVNTKRVLTGDTRFALWRSLDELLDAIHERHQDTHEDAAVFKTRFEKLFAEFNSSRDQYEKLDTELCALDDRLADEEMRLYGHLSTTANVPVQSVYNHSFPLLSVPDQPPSRDDLPYGEPSADGTDPYESKYGLGTSVGNYPRPITVMPQNSPRGHSPSIVDEDKIEPDIPIAEPLHDKGLSGLMEENGFFLNSRPFSSSIATESWIVDENKIEPDIPIVKPLHDKGFSELIKQNVFLPDPTLFSSPIGTAYQYPVNVSKSSVLFGTTPQPHSLILDNRSPNRLRRYILEFDSKVDRVNKWLLHNLRTSPLEIERLRNSYDDDPRTATMDERTWAEHVLEVWPQDSYPVASELNSQPGSALISDSTVSMKQNLKSDISDRLESEGSNHVDHSKQYQDPKSWSLISHPKHHEISSDAVPSTKVNHERAATRSCPPPGVTEYAQWPKKVSKPQALMRRVRLICGRLRPIKGPLRQKRQRPRGPPIISRAIKEGPINDPGADGLLRKKDIIDSVSPSRETDGTSRRISVNPPGNAVPSRETSRLKHIDSEPTRKDFKQWAAVDPTSRPILKTLHTKLLSVGQVFLVSIDSLVNSNPMESPLSLIFKEIYPSIVSLIVIQLNSPFGVLTACPVLENDSHKLNLTQNKYENLVVCSDVPEYNSETKIHVLLTDQAYVFPFQELSRLNPTFKFKIPFDVPTRAIGYTYPYDIQKISHDPESTQQKGNYPWRKVLTALRRAGSGSEGLYSNDKEYAFPETRIEPESFWDAISTDPLVLNNSQPPHYSTIV